MKNLILIVMLLVNIGISAPPKDITGKWQVADTDVSKIELKLTGKEKPIMLSMMKQIFKNGVFDFRTNHQCYVTIKAPNMPHNLVWEYRADTGDLLITEASDHNSKIMVINVTEKGGQTYFAIKETGLVLKMLKL